MTATDIITEWFEDHRDQYLDVIIAGRIFGGRHGESMQRPTGFDCNRERLVIQFATTEQLIVDNPSDVRRGKYGQLIISSGTRAVFGWHYYSRDPSPENWCEQIYVSYENRIKLTRTGPWMPGVEVFQYSGNRFVELR